MLFETGRDFDAAGIGPVGAGLLPIVRRPKTVVARRERQRVRAGKPDERAPRSSRIRPALPINLRRLGFPDDISIVFSDAVVDTGIDLYPVDPWPGQVPGLRAPEAGDRQLDFRFRDLDGDGTLSADRASTSTS